MLTAKQERFAQLVASEGMTLTAAYLDAGYSSKALRKSLWESASKLAADAKVAPRVEEIRKAARERAGITLETHLARLDEIGQAALEGEAEVRDGEVIKIVKNFGAAVAAEVARGKHSGVAAPDKHQDVTPDIPAEDAITELCTQAGVIHETARAHFMKGLRALNTPYTPLDDTSKPTSPAPDMVQ